MILNTLRFWVILVSGVFTICISSCTKYNDPPLVFEKEEVTPFSKDYKVLLVSIDGLSGIELEKYVPVNINSLLDKSKYTFEGFSDSDSGDAATWTTILSGKSHTYHGIHGNSFEEDLDEDDPHGNNNTGTSTGYVTLFQRLLETGKPLKSLSVTSLASVDQNLFGLSDSRILRANDAEVKEAAVKAIAEGENNLSFSIVNFRSVNDAGLTAGFSIDNPAYKEALDQVDEYVGDIITALKSRKNYSKENWLVVVTSNHGGLNNTYGGASLEERKVPIIFYNENFEKVKFEAPDLVNSIFVNKVSTGIPTLVDQNAYEIGTAGEYTVMSKVYVDANGGSNSVLYGKTTHAYSGTRGWHLMTQVADKKFRYILGYGTLLFITSSKPYELKKWYSVVLRVYDEDGKRYAAIYQDGELVNTPVDITGRNLTAGATRPLFIGPGHSTSNLTGGGGTAFGVSPSRINDLAFYERALSVEEIQAYTCKTDWNDNDFSDVTLKGFWSLDEGSGDELKNSIQTATNTSFKIADKSFAWTLNPQWTCKLEEELLGKVVINQFDIFPQIAYWLKVKTDESWKLEGRLFLDSYEKEFLGK